MITIYNLYFTDSNLSPEAVLSHEAGHLAGLNDQELPRKAPPGIGRYSTLTQQRGAYGAGAASWLAANNPSLARRNNDNYQCFVLGNICGGP